MNVVEVSINPNPLRSDEDDMVIKSTQQSYTNLINIINDKNKYMTKIYQGHLVKNRNHSNFTEDSSPSSSFTKTMSGEVDNNLSYTKRASNISVDVSRQSTSSSKNKSGRSAKAKKRLSADKDLTSETMQNNSDADERVKVSNSLSMEFASTTKITSQKIRDCPEIVTREMSFESSDKKGCPVEAFNKIIRKMVTRAVQTLPVLILPLPTEDKIIGTIDNIVEDVLVKPEKSMSKDKENFLKTQSRVSRSLNRDRQLTVGGHQTHGRTNSEVINVRIRKKESVESKTVSDELNISDGVWGDVYNDYKINSGEDSSKLLVKPENKPNIKTNTATSGDSFKPVELVVPKKPVIQPSFIGIVNNKPYRITSELDRTEHGMYQKLFEVPPFDEIVKSYVNRLDRRIRAICSRMNCKINLYGPTIKHIADSKSTTNLSSREKTIFTLHVITNSREKLEKSIKCMQETFPRACLTERTWNHQLSDYLGEEIPL